ncbi:MAG: ABC transporter permease [Oscillospiraceae bacterium]|nr:MAG: ABC transporter permease [Oscillospiraceae bacterium]
MTGISALIKRNIKLYFRDKGMFFSSLITPIILLILFVTFLGSIYRDSFASALSAAGINADAILIDGCVGGQLISSLLAVTCITVAFCSNLIMIKDKTSGARRDLTVSPLHLSTLGFSYYLAALISTLIINLTAAAVSLAYLAFVGWYLSSADVLLLILDVFLLTMFGTALSSCVNFFLSSDGQASAVGTIVSAGYGFICGAYMPVSNFSPVLQKILSFLPGTYGTVLLRNHAMRGAFRQMTKDGIPQEVIEKICDSVDCNLYFFGEKVSVSAMYMVLCASILLFIGIYIAVNLIKEKRAD